MGKRLLLFGPPGVGKGTHSKRLARELGIPHVATGDMFRRAAKGGAVHGERVAGFINHGQLVPDDLAVAMLDERLSEADASDGFLLDGFPRTVRQAQALDERLRRTGQRLDSVLSLEAPEAVLVERISGRLSCPACGAAFHVTQRPPRAAGVCDACGGALFQREDDTESVVRRRLKEYAAKTAPVLAYFRSENWPVRSVSSTGSAEEVYLRIRGAAEA